MSSEVVGTSDQNKDRQIKFTKLSLGAGFGLGAIGLGLLLSPDVHANPSKDIHTPTPTETPTIFDINAAHTVTPVPGEKMATSEPLPTLTITPTFTASPTREASKTPYIQPSRTATATPAHRIYLPEIKRITGEPVVVQKEDKMRQYPETIYITPALRDIIFKYLQPQPVRPENSGEIIKRSENGRNLVHKQGNIYYFVETLPGNKACFIYEIALDNTMLDSVGPTPTPTPTRTLDGTPYPPPFYKKGYSNIPPENGAQPYWGDPTPTKAK